MLWCNLRARTGSSHIDTGSTVALRDIFITPVTLRLATYFNPARSAAIRWWMRQLGTSRIADTENVARLFLPIFLGLHSFLLCRHKVGSTSGLSESGLTHLLRQGGPP